MIPRHAGNSTYSNSRADAQKVPISGRPTVIHLLHSPLNYGYLGDQCVPGLNLTSPGSSSSSNHKWRIICKVPSHLYVVVLALDVSGEDYLQVRRRALRGSVDGQYQSLGLQKNSILIGYVQKSGQSSNSTVNPFRLAYVCAGTGCALVWGNFLIKL